MKKVAVAIECHGAGGQWKLVSGPSDDVAAIIDGVKAIAAKRGRGDNTLAVLTTLGVEKVYKVGAEAPKKGLLK